MFNLTSISLSILTEPVPWARPRLTLRGKSVHGYLTGNVKSVMGIIKDQVKNQLPTEFKPLEGPLSIDIQVRKTRPKSTKKSVIWPIVRPDLDNYLKIVLDSLNSIVFRDDSQFCSITIRKVYSTEPGYLIHIEQMEGSQ